MKNKLDSIKDQTNNKEGKCKEIFYYIKLKIKETENMKQNWETVNICRRDPGISTTFGPETMGWGTVGDREGKKRENFSELKKNTSLQDKDTYWDNWIHMRKK